MSEMNKGLLKSNIRDLLDSRKVTQAEIAQVTGMSQPNVSKALNPNDKKCFTVDQLFAIAQHFRVSIDELVGNRAVEQRTLSPRAVLAFLVELLCNDKVKTTKWVGKDEVFTVMYGAGQPQCDHGYQDVEYPAFYFPSYFQLDDLDIEDPERYELFQEFCQCGNETPYCAMNDIITKLIPMMELYKNREIPEEAFRMIVKCYLEQLSNR